MNNKEEKVTTAECTWGDGPDVLVIVDGSRSALVKHLNGKSSFGLKLEEARSLAFELLGAVALCETLELDAGRPLER